MITQAVGGEPLGVMVPRSLPAGKIPTFVEGCEQLGFDEVWIVEDLGYRGGITLAAIALAVTSTLRVGVGVLPAAARNVAFAAMETVTLAEMFPGRLTVAIGHGMPLWMGQVGSWLRSPLTLLAEYLTALRALLRGERVTATGRYVMLSDVALERPPAVAPFVFAGVRAPKFLAISGQVADGTLSAEPVTPEYLHVAHQEINASRTHEMVAYNVAAVDADPGAARDLARTAVSAVGESAWAPHIRPLSFAAELAALRRTCATPEDFALKLPDAWVHQLAVTGTPDTAGRRIQQLRRAGANRVILRPPAGPTCWPTYPNSDGSCVR